MKRYSFILAPVFLLTWACELEEAPDYGRAGNEVRFSGWIWDVKSGSQIQGPGPNYFSDEPEDIFIDGQGYLHMRIAEHDGRWYSTEIVSRDTVGYGEYTWVISGNFEDIPNNTVLGLFTWNTESFMEEGNSEVDIELAKWADDDNQSLHFSVQPVNFGPYYPERTYMAPTNDGDLIGVSTHMFSWTDSLITWRSWKGVGTGGEQIASWEFSDTNQARVKNENGLTSDSIVIPRPLNHTNVRINYWMLFGSPPADGQEHEVVIQSFNYVPYTEE
jgi:hypothetical protein